MRVKDLLAGVAALTVVLPSLALAQTTTGQDPDQEPVYEINEAVLRPFPIAVVDFGGANGSAISSVIRGNLERSGFFDPLDPSTFTERSLAVSNQPTFDAWTGIGAQAVLYGTTSTGADGRVNVGFRLYDPYRRCQLVGYSFTATPENWRRVAHKISDVVYQRMTGEPGYFDTRVVFVSESGTELNRISRLTIMDQDGYNPFFLTDGSEIILTPRFSRDSSEITYMALGKDYTRIYLYNVNTGRRESLGQFDGQVFAPRFSPDGSKIAFSIARGGNTDIHIMDLRSREFRRLTTDPGIDTSPSFSPDGSRIVFNSDRAGSARLYTMNADGSGQRAISRGGGSYHTPAWSPRGDLVAFTKSSGGQFHIGVMNADGSGERILSSSYFEEGPSWAPNGRYIMYARKAANGATRLRMVDVTGRVLRQVEYDAPAADPAWSGLIDPPPANLGYNQGPDSCPAG